MSPDDDDLQPLLEYIRSSRGFDFTGYKPSTLHRRITGRMQMLGIDGYPLYLDKLQVDPEEFRELFDYFLINVTSFFRDPEIWEVLRDQIVPRILGTKGDRDAVRVWCAGCATGQEAYTLAMILSEALGDGSQSELKIYATDIDVKALAIARQGTYSPKDVETVPSGLRDRYFEKMDGNLVIDKNLRRSVIFGRHDLLQDAPISKVDLLTCRNTLMYFNSETQQMVMNRFAYGLADGGFLVLGKAEMMVGYNRQFVPANLKSRIFSKTGARPLGKDGVLLRASDDGHFPDGAAADLASLKIAFESAPVAQVVVDASGLMLRANSRARDLFGLKAADLGRPFQDLEMSYTPAELRSLMTEAQTERKKVGLMGVLFKTSSTEVHLDIDVVPLFDNGEDLVGVGIHFLDVSREKNLRDALQQSNHELETAMEELLSTNEELETTNEELQSTNEELETMNEELQSTNEELETMNEELQSTTEELSATNDELRSRTGELNQLNQYLQTMMESINAAVIVLDTGLRVRVWNKHSFEMWGLREEEVVGELFLGLDIGLPLDRLGSALMSCLSGQAAVQTVGLEALSRRGKQFVCKVTITPMVSESSKVSGAILLLEEAARQS